MREDGGGWRDLATGRPTRLHIEPLPADWASRDRQLEDERRSAETTVVDWGRLNTAQWFEAHTTEPHPAGSACDDAARLTAREVEGVSAPGLHAVPLNVTEGSDAVEMASALARRLRAMGFVSLRASLASDDMLRAHLAHRHLALMVCEEDDRVRAPSAMHLLVSVSPRTHLVIHASSGCDYTTRRGASSSLVRERGYGWEHAGRSIVQRTDPYMARLRRAIGAARRRRPGDAERWARAALESARRHRHDDGQMYACGVVVDRLLGRDAYAEAVDLAEGVVRQLRGRPAWIGAAGVLAGVLTERGELDRAEALLSTALADVKMRGVPPPSILHIRRAWLRAWQGRFDEAMAAAEMAPSSAETAVVSGFSAWARRDRARLRQSAALLAATANRAAGAALWAQTFTVLAATVDEHDPATLASAAGNIILATAHVDDTHAVRLTRLLAADLLLLADRPIDAVRALGPPSAWARASTVEQWLSEWIRTGLDPDQRHRLRAACEVTGARGIQRWGAGRDPMYCAHAVPALLQLVQEAESETSALNHSCAWLRRAGEADAVAVFGAEDRSVVASDGWGPADTAITDIPGLDASTPAIVDRGTARLVVAPVRYGGTLIGYVVARGPRDGVPALLDLVSLVAVLCAPALQARLDALAVSRRGASLTPEILGCSPAIAALRDVVARAGATPFPVLIEGESGTGKELVARAIHRLSSRRDRRFSAVNCAALTDELLEAELFGHSRGAFTGAIHPRIGLFEEASGGSLFLDEVSELSPRGQAKLLRVLQEREVRRIGENSSRPVDVRIIAATNQPLAEAVGRATFRGDLLFRLAVVRIRLTPLRERPEDVPVLARSFWRTLTAEAGRPVILGPDALAALCRHAWPGNVREFQNVMAALLVIAPARGRVSARHVAQVLSGPSESAESVPLHALRLQCERRAIQGALARHGGRRAAAARELGLTRQGLVKALRRVGLHEEGGAEGVA